jgi:serine protease AprX
MDRWFYAVVVACTLAILPVDALAAEPTPHWVFFADKNVASVRLEHALKLRVGALSIRALDRRRRIRGDRGIDERDLDVDAGYISGVSATGARVRVTSRWLNAVSVWATPAQLAQLAALPYVRGTLPVSGGKRSEPQQLGRVGGKRLRYPQHLTSGNECGVAFGQLDLIQAPAMHDCGLTGSGVIVAVLDTGFRLAHEAFAQLDVMAQRDFINDDMVVENETGDPAGQHNHGTSVLSLLAGRDPGDYLGVAPDVTVILAKTEDISQEQPIEEDWFVEGMEWAESLGAHILTASLGYIDWYTPGDLDGQTAVTTVAVNIAVQNGLIVLSAAGNDGPGPSTLGAPADAAGLITVGAVNADGVVTNFSSRGPTADMRIKPDVCARGRANWVVQPGSTTAYEQGNGTSYATPMVAGVAALLLQAYPDLTPAEMSALLTSTATNASMPDNDYGYGIVRGYDAAGLYCTCRDVDGDKFFDLECGGTDCDDADAAVNSSGTEVCNGHDDDCDGALFEGEEDADGDGALACDDDCDDSDANVRPGALEICDDDVDNDCDGNIDGADDDCGQPSTDPDPVAVPPAADDGDCGCELAPARPGGWAIGCISALGLLLLRRRRRR